MAKEIAEVLRQAITNSGKSVNEISKQTGVPQPTIARFMQGRDMRLSRAQKIASYLGLSLNRDK